MGMPKYHKHNLLWAFSRLVLLAGCAQPQSTVPKEGPLCLSDIGMADAMNAAETTLRRMHFAIEKADPVRGIIRTKPLTGAQFFELWRSDNVGVAQTTEASIHTIRRSVELQVRPAEGQVRIECSVQVQRLSLPENEVASVSQAYRMYSKSTPTLQRLELEPGQKEQLAWIDMGEDPALAKRILKRIAQKI